MNARSCNKLHAMARNLMLAGRGDEYVHIMCPEGFVDVQAHDLLFMRELPPLTPYPPTPKEEEPVLVIIDEWALPQ